jgi:hypothetical protein
MDNGSPFRTDTWSDSSHSSTAFNQLPASVIGKKRSHPRASKASSDRLEEGFRETNLILQHPSSSSHEKRSIAPHSQSHALERLESVSSSDAADSIDIAHSTTSSERNELNDRDQSPPRKREGKLLNHFPRGLSIPGRSGIRYQGLVPLPVCARTPQ